MSKLSFLWLSSDGTAPQGGLLRSELPSPLIFGLCLAQVKGVEPSYTVLETAVLPLNYTHIKPDIMLRPAAEGYGLCSFFLAEQRPVIFAM